MGGECADSSSRSGHTRIWIVDVHFGPHSITARGHKIPRRIPENAKDRGSISRPFSNLFNVACKPVGSNHHEAILTIGMAESQGLRNAGDAMSPLLVFSSGMKRRTGPPVCRDDPVPKREAQQGRSLASERSASHGAQRVRHRYGVKVEKTANEKSLKSVQAVLGNDGLLPCSPRSVAHPGRDRRGVDVQTTMICINSVAHSMG